MYCLSLKLVPRYIVPTKQLHSMADSPNVLILVLDSLRTDRVSCYGHDRQTTPRLDELATKSTRYINAYTPAPWTLPTHVSLFTGLFPSEHGITNAFPNSNIQIPKSIPTLAEELQDVGYRTAGFSNNPWVGQTSGLDRGFDDFIEWNLHITNESISDMHSKVDRITSRLCKWVGLSASQPIYLLKRPFFTSSLTRRVQNWLRIASNWDEPWFCFINLMEAHSPYFPPDEVFHDLSIDQPSLIEPRILNIKLLAYIMEKANLSPGTRERVLEYYDASAHFQDKRVGDIIDCLIDFGSFEDTMIIVCSDHGKTLGEYDRSGEPPHSLRDLSARVPLLIHDPGQEDGVVQDAPVELASLYHYVLEGGGLPFRIIQPIEEGALTESYLPMTSSRQPMEVTKWRSLSTTDLRIISDQNGGRYFLKDKGLDESLDDGLSMNGKSRLIEFLDQRVSMLDSEIIDEDGRKMGDIGSDVKAQLRGLGYLE